MSGVKYMSKNVRKRKTPIVARINPRGAAAIVVLGIFLMCVVVLISKAFFVSNSKTMPEGIDTATVTAATTPVPADESAVPGAVTTTVPVTTTAPPATTTEASTTKAAVKMKVLDVTYLKQEPDEQSENIIVLSPNIEVDVLETLDSGWSKITFLNVTGQLTGYIQTTFLY